MRRIHIHNSLKFIVDARSLCTMLVCVLLPVVNQKSAWSQEVQKQKAQNSPQSALVSSTATGKSARLDTKGVVLGEVSNALSDLKLIYKYISLFRASNNGNYPSRGGELLPEIDKDFEQRDREKGFDSLSVLTNPDSRFADSPFFRSDPEFTVAYAFYKIRRDGTPVGGPKYSGTKDALVSTGIYYHINNKFLDGRVVDNPAGFYVVLWDDGQVDKIPYDQVLFAPTLKNRGLVVSFPGQAGVPTQSLTYEENWTTDNRSDVVPLGKPLSQDRDVPLYDNGGPESLITLSRFLSFPTRYGIEREELWKNFDPAQEEFTLAEVQAGAAKLNLPLDLKTFSLDEVQTLNAPAIFLTSDDKRIVVLSQLDDKDAIVIDRGLTRIVTRDLLSKRYGGQVLVASSTSTPAANAPQVLADDPVRSLALTSPDQVLTQTVKITNRGTAPLSLQVERPIPGAERADLSASTVAPGESATLSLSLRWRPVLKTPMQNVLVFLKTNDPRRPRLPLGFKLTLPQAAAPAAP